MCEAQDTEVSRRKGNLDRGYKRLYFLILILYLLFIFNLSMHIVYTTTLMSCVAACILRRNVHDTRVHSLVSGAISEETNIA